MSAASMALSLAVGTRKAAKVRRLLTEQPRQCDDWRQQGVTARMLESICVQTMNPLWLLKGQRVIYRFVPPGFEQLTTDQKRDHQAIVMAVTAGHAFFYRCPDARRCIQHMKVDYEPAYRKHARLIDHAVDDDLDHRLLYSDM